MKKTKDRSIDDYIAIEKWYRIILFFFVYIPFFCFTILYMKVESSFSIFLFLEVILFPYIIVLDIRIISLKKKIKKYLVKNDLLKQMGTIIYWYERESGSGIDFDFLLTDHYVVLRKKSQITSFPYHFIDCVKLKETYHGGSHGLWQKDLLFITLKNGEVHEMLLYSGRSVAKFHDVVPFFLKKNPNITVLESEIEDWYRAYF